MAAIKRNGNHRVPIPVALRLGISFRYTRVGLKIVRFGHSRSMKEAETNGWVAMPPRHVAIGVATIVTFYVTMVKNFRMGNGEFAVCVAILAVALCVTLLDGDGPEVCRRRQTLTDASVDWVSRMAAEVAKRGDVASFFLDVDFVVPAWPSAEGLYDLGSSLLELVFGR